MPRVVLTHKCNRPGCEGDPGDILDLTEDLASYLLQRKGAKLKPKPAKDGDEGDSDEETPGGSAGQGSATDAGGPSGGPQESARSARRRNKGRKEKQPDETTSGDGGADDAENGDSSDPE